MKRFMTVLVGCLFLVSFLPAQDITLFNSDNSGLYTNAVYCIDFDLDGNIWFGGQRDVATGQAKVCRLATDLTTWTVFEQSDLAIENMEDRVYYMACDNEGTMWLTTHYGFAYYMADGTAGEVDFTFDDYTRTSQVDSDGHIYLSDRTVVGIYVSTDNGENWDLWDRDTLGMPATDRPEIYDLGTTTDGRKWYCTWYGVYFRNTDGSWGNIPETLGLYTYAMTIDPNDHLWVPISGDNELFEIAPDGTVTVHDAAGIDILNFPINDLEADGEGNIWLATDGGGLVKLMPDLTYTQWDSANTANAIVQNNLTHMEIKDAVIWASTESEGILRIAGVVPNSIDTPHGETANSFRLNNNYPNPFNPTTNISFNLQTRDHVTLAVYNIQGQLITTLADGVFTAGFHELTWDGTNTSGIRMASGVYLYKLTAGTQQQTRKMVLVK